MTGNRPNAPLKCAFVGDETLAIQCATIALDQGLAVVVMASSHPQVLDFAAERGINSIDLRTAGADLAEALRAHDFDVLLSTAYLSLLPKAVLDQAPLRINFHDGPLPGYAGLNVTTWALWNGESEHGVTWHLMTEQADRGEIIATAAVPIAADETAFSLNIRCLEAGVEAFAGVAAALAAGALETRAQPDGARRLYRRRNRPLVFVDPTQPAARIHRAIRALNLGDRVANTAGAVRLVLGDEVFVATEATLPADLARPGSRPGAVVGLDGAGLRLATADGDILLTTLRTAGGALVDAAELAARHGLAIGAVGPAPTPALAAALDDLDPKFADHEPWWRRRLAGVEPTAPTLLLDGDPTDWRELRLDIDSPPEADVLAAALGVWLGGVSGASRVTFACTDADSRRSLDLIHPLACPPLVDVAIDAGATFDAVRRDSADALADAAAHGPFFADLVYRTPELRGRDFAAPVAIDLAVAPGSALPGEGRMRLTQRTDGTVALRHRLPEAVAQRIADQLSTVLRAALKNPAGAVAGLPLVGALDTAMLDGFNATAVDHDRTVTIDQLFRRQAAATPDAAAVTSADRTTTYAELLIAVERLAGRLEAAGVGRGDTVGIALERGVEMVTAVLAVLSRGAAYLPLDPGYPQERLQHMVGDSGAHVLVARPEVAAGFEASALVVLDPESEPVAEPRTATDGQHGPDDLAYLIYTSGSTGAPKGVQVQHNNVVNFFVAMDAVVEPDPPGVWLAVTSLSFDISVLELLWTLTRGYHVVVKRDTAFRALAEGAAPTASAPKRPVSMSLFYFSAGQAQAGEGYRLLLEGARWADAQGFEAVWTPERHFHDFGAAYPNPSVVSAALAATTKRIAVRAGSVVLPLHSPVRVAEEWAVVDNLSNGRVGIAFAAGWQPNDFVLNPGAYATARDALPGMVDTVRRLWRGETVELPGHDGAPVQVRTLPRPVQAELPVWITSAGSPASFERAGRLGFNVLTHLLGQSVTQLAENIARYRAGRREAGHPGEGRVTLMLHTFLDKDAAVARERARRPLANYLSTAVGLLKDIASSFPTFARSGADADAAFKSLTADEMAQLLDLAAERYLSTSGLFGTADDAVAMVHEVAGAGVDEVACLIDFGIDTDTVLGSLDLLSEVHSRVNPAVDTPSDTVASPAHPEETIAGLIQRHGVTHLQCTPSLAAMLMADPADRESLRSIRHLMLGGEAMPAALAGELRQLLPDRFTNMYGPTETTIWSLTHEVDLKPSGPVPIGAAIANTTVFVLDAWGRRLPVGAFGELYIGGEGVTRGYHARPDLTAARFVERPEAGRVYATGDIVRAHPDGYIEFAGRSDNQVKIRGHRIELGEIESVFDRHEAVAQSVVVVRGDSDPFLVAFVVLRRDRPVSQEELREHARAALPDAMVPSTVVVLDALPLTDNGKVDRKRLPAEVAPAPSAQAAASLPPSNDAEALVSGIWTAELGRPVGRNDNFFELGGHSLLAVKIFRRLSVATGASLALTDIFRYPTVRSFAARLDALQAAETAQAAQAAPTLAPASQRGLMRRQALAHRKGDPVG